MDFQALLVGIKVCSTTLENLTVSTKTESTHTQVPGISFGGQYANFPKFTKRYICECS